MHGCYGGLRGCGGERLAKRVAVVECNVAVESDQKRGCCSERVAVVEHSVAIRRGVTIADGSGCNGSGQDGSPSSRCMNLPLLSLEDFRVNSSFLCHV